jgi:hypothetical protein
MAATDNDNDDDDYDVDGEEDPLNTSDGQAAEQGLAIAEAYLNRPPSRSVSATSSVFERRRIGMLSRSVSASSASSSSSLSLGEDEGGDEYAHDEVFLASQADRSTPISYSLAELGISLPAAEKLKRSASASGQLTYLIGFIFVDFSQYFAFSLNLQNPCLERNLSVACFR